MADNTTAPVLEIKKIVDRDVVRFEDQTYELLQADQLSIVEYTRYATLFNRSVELTEKIQNDTITPSEEQELERAVDRMARILLRAPAEVHDQLTSRQRQRIVMSFLRLPPMLSLPAAADQAPSASTGASSSPHSSASMEATPSGG